MVLQLAGCKNAKHASPSAVRNKPDRLVFSISHHSSAKIAGRGYQKYLGMGKLWEKLGSPVVTLLRKVRRHGAAAWLRTSVKSWCCCCSAASLWSFSPVSSFHYPSPKFPGRSSRKSFRNWKGCEYFWGNCAENSLPKAIALLDLGILNFSILSAGRQMHG